jgi:hypothetical protein
MFCFIVAVHLDRKMQQKNNDKVLLLVIWGMIEFFLEFEFLTALSSFL